MFAKGGVSFIYYHVYWDKAVIALKTHFIEQSEYEMSFRHGYQWLVINAHHCDVVYHQLKQVSQFERTL